ncbi:MAG: VWA domain-containing protein [Deltaproteobacteria bacterium]|nr:VWA domain-containing protein [Deltaproteobacteria bacterium]
MNAWRFANPALLGLVVLLAPVVYASLVGRGQGRLRFSSLDLVREAQGGRPALLRSVPLMLRVGAMFLLVLAVARPQGGVVQKEVLSEGVDIALVIDTSESMRAMDFNLGAKSATRLQVVKKVVNDFIGRRVNDRIGLVVFGEEALIQCPHTTDYGVLKQTLAAVKRGMAGGNTAIGNALGMAVTSLKELPGDSRIVVLLTDGENTTGILDPLQAARAAATYGIKVYTIGVGSTGRARFQTPFGIEYQEVSLDEETLEGIAEATGGRYFRATDTEGLERIYALIDELEKTKVEVREYTDYEELYPLLLWPALLLLTLDVMLRTTWLRTLP